MSSGTLKQYIKAFSRIDEREYQSNPSVYMQIMNDKKALEEERDKLAKD